MAGSPLGVEARTLDGAAGERAVRAVDVGP